MIMKCDVCECDLQDERNRDVSGMQIDLLGAHPARKKVEEIFGKNRFRICHVCLLNSLGVKKRHAKQPS